MTKQADLQNEFIKERLAKVNLAVNVLHTMGLTVLSINIETANPLIAILPGAACQQFDTAITKYKSTGGERRQERVAIVADCQVRWEEAA